MSSGRWLKRLEQISSADYPWDPNSLRGDFFGEDWILPQAFREACRTDRIDELKRLLSELRDRPFKTLYEEQAVQEQGIQLVCGAIGAVLAACGFVEERTNVQAVADTLRRAAASFNAAWPAYGSNVPVVRHPDDDWFAAYAGGGSVQQTLGFWTAWDLFDRLLGPMQEANSQRRCATDTPGRVANTCRVARLPVLLYDVAEGAG